MMRGGGFFIRLLAGKLYTDLGYLRQFLKHLVSSLVAMLPSLALPYTPLFSRLPPLIYLILPWSLPVDMKWNEFQDKVAGIL